MRDTPSLAAATAPVIAARGLNLVFQTADGPVQALKAVEAPLDPGEAVSDPALVGARLAHRRWSEAQSRRLNQQLAMVTADWMRQKPAAAKAFASALSLDSATTVGSMP